MCNLHFAIYSCKHIQELHTTQCPIWINTSSMCAKPQTTTQSVATLCYQCSIIEESSQVDLATLDRKARGLLKGLTDQMDEGKGRSTFGERVTREAVEQLGRYVDVYSCKAQMAEQTAKEERRKRGVEREKRLNERAKRHSERSDLEGNDEREKVACESPVVIAEWSNGNDGEGSVSSKRLPTDRELERGRLRELETKINSITDFWRAQVQSHEEQMEAAGRSHSTWRLSGTMSRLGVAHRIWNQRIKEAFEDADGALGESWSNGAHV